MSIRDRSPVSIRATGLPDVQIFTDSLSPDVYATGVDSETSVDSRGLETGTWQRIEGENLGKSFAINS